VTARTLTVADALVGPDYSPSGPSAIDLDGDRIAAVRPLPAAPAGRRLLALPAPIDAHDHARPLSPTSFGAALKPLELWLPRLAVVPPVDAELAATAALGRAVAGGVAGVMVHLVRTAGPGPMLDEARAVARAAGRLGVPVGFALGMRDRHPLVLGDHTALLADLPAETAEAVRRAWLAPAPSVAEQLARTDEIAAALAGPGFDVQYGPNGVQWCSDTLLEAVAAASAGTGRRVHMHLLETKPQRDWADATFPGGIVAHLDRLGLLSPRLTVAHAVWARPTELELLAERGVRVVVNPSSNLHLASGIAPAAAMRDAGVEVALGLDGCALDEDDDALRELRLLRLLNAGRGFEDGLDGAGALRAACGLGRGAIGLEGKGTIASGEPADLLLLDLDALDRDRLMPLDPRELLFTRARREHVVEVVVAGRPVARDGRPLAVDLDAVHAELRDACRAASASGDDARAAWPALEPRLAAFYGARLGCGCA